MTTVLEEIHGAIHLIGQQVLRNSPDDGEIRLMRGQTQHDEISICSTEAMPRVWIVAWTCALLTDEVHDLVFTFPRHIGVRENDLWI